MGAGVGQALAVTRVTFLLILYNIVFNAIDVQKIHNITICVIFD